MTKQVPIINRPMTPVYDLENRTYRFAKNAFDYSQQLTRSLTHQEISKQLIRSAGSVGANYIEANEAVSKKDFIWRIKICRKEVKETRYWLLLTTPSIDIETTRNRLVKESTELLKIFSSIIMHSA